MKSRTEQVISRCMAKLSEGRVSRKERDHEEMHTLFGKLKELVPTMPRNKKLTKLDIIQNVIDYILDLEIALETHPANFSSSRPSASAESPVRHPLGVLPPSANSALNTCSPKEVSNTDKAPSHFAELLSAAVSPNRPMSC